MSEEIPRWKQRLADNQEARSWNLTSLLLTLPLLVIGFYYYGAQALRTAAVGALAAVLAELAFGRLLLRRRTLDDWNAVVIGLWVACMLPATLVPRNTAPLYAAAGAVFAVLVAKLPFGGTLHAPFTPAAAGFAFLTVCFPQKVFAYAPSAFAPPTHASSLARMLQQGRSVMSGGQAVQVLLGQTVGPMGTGGIFVLAVVLLCMFLLKGRRTAALASVGCIGAAALLAFAFPRVTIPAGLPLAEVLHLRAGAVGMELCAGSLLFAAVFLLPDPAVLPRRWFTRLGFGAIAGALAFLLRSLGSFEENVCFAILLADAAMPLLYRAQAEMHHQKEFREKVKAEEEAAA
jgi:electron transport complex protein RnfD